MITTIWIQKNKDKDSFDPFGFLLMKEECVKRNPPKKETFAKGTSVESDREGMSIAS